jgi:hypothetical protein
MLHRGEISEAQFRTLLRALDYPPFWREKIEAIALLVPGRIDLKRMLRHGIKSRAEVKAGYVKLGYSETDAESMTAIAVAELDTSETASPWAQRARSRLFTVAHNEFVDESITEAQARTLLGRIGASASEADTIISLWEAEAAIDRRELTPAQIVKAYKKGRWTFEQAHSELIERGYTPEDADTLLGIA